MRRDIPYANWHMHLLDAIADAEDGDEIVCHSEAMAELAKIAVKRMCPGKDLLFTVSSGEEL